MKFNITQFQGKWTVWWTHHYTQPFLVEDVQLCDYCLQHYSNQFSVIEKEEFEMFLHEVRFKNRKELDWFLLQWS